MSEPQRWARAGCYFFGLAAAAGTALQFLGWSPGRVSSREKGIDLFLNHLFVFGPCIFLCWLFFFLGGNKRRIWWFPIVATLLFVIGLKH